MAWLDHWIKLWYLNNVNRALSQRLEEEVPKRLAELLAVPLSRIKVQRQPAAGRGKPVQTDLLVAVGEFNFIVEWKTTGQAAAVAIAARAAQQFAAQWKKKSIPLVAVPYMPDRLPLSQTVPENPSCSPEEPPRFSLAPTVRYGSQRQNALISN